MSEERDELPGFFESTRGNTCRMFYPYLFEPRTKFKDTALPKARYEAVFAWHKESPDFAIIRGLVGKVLRQAYPTQYAQLLAAMKEGKPFDHIIKLPWRQSKADPNLFEIAAHSFNPVQLSILNSKGEIFPFVDTIGSTARSRWFYPGVEVGVCINFMPYKPTLPPGVNGYLNHIVSTGKGTPVGPGRRATLTGFAGTVSDTDPTEGMDDEIPF